MSRKEKNVAENKNRENQYNFIKMAKKKNTALLFPGKSIQYYKEKNTFNDLSICSWLFKKFHVKSQAIASDHVIWQKNKNAGNPR